MGSAATLKWILFTNDSNATPIQWERAQTPGVMSQPIGNSLGTPTAEQGKLDRVTAAPEFDEELRGSSTVASGQVPQLFTTSRYTRAIVTRTTESDLAMCLRGEVDLSARRAPGPTRGTSLSSAHWAWAVLRVQRPTWQRAEPQ